MYSIDVVTIKMEKERSFFIEDTKISCNEDAYRIVNKYLNGADREHLVLLTIDTKGNINSISTVSIGSLNSSIVHPREVFKPAILSNAAAIILAHNHPSGDPTPSHEDIGITNRIKGAGNILGIELLAHIIIGDNCPISFKENKLL